MKRPPYDLLVVLVLRLLAPSPASADPPREDILWHVCAHEAGLPRWSSSSAAWVNRRGSLPWGPDCWAIHEVLLRGAEREGISYARYARWYSGRVFEQITEPERVRDRAGLSLDRIPEGYRNRWASFLARGGRRPAGWPRGMPWIGEHGGQASAAYALDLAIEIVAHELADVGAWSICDAAVEDWGGHVDREHAREIGLVVVSCRGTQNDFYSRPWLAPEVTQ
jgi:hypothetical protein